MTDIYKDLLPLYLLTPMPNGTWGMPVHIQGKPGIGKSDQVEAVSASLGLDTYTTYGSAIRPEDIPGLPAIAKTEDGQTRTEYTIPEMVWRAQQKPTTLFFDEITGAQDDVQFALLGVVQRRYCGPHPLPEHTRIILASNPADTVGGQTLTHAMANRLAWLDADVDAGKWLDWFGSHGLGATTKLGDIEQNQATVMAAWNTHWPRVQGAISGFIRARGADSLYDEPKSMSQKIGPWPSPRSVTNAAHVLTTALCLGMEQHASAAISAIVGQAWAIELVTYITEADLPDPAAVLRGEAAPPNFKTRRPDHAFAFATALSSAVRPTIDGAAANNRRAVADTFWRLTSEIGSLFADVGDMLTRAAFKSRIPELMASRAAKDAVVTHRGLSGASALIFSKAGK